jgi:NAD(P)-dependent dehydrogenase (short-subunit alcohol dehydrogenase family)
MKSNVSRFPELEGKIGMTNHRSIPRRTLLAAAVVGAVASSVGAAFGQPRTPDAPWLRGKTALVTGSTDGLGREVATRLGSLGATVIVHGRSAERCAEVVAAIEANGGQAVFYRADLASLAEVREFADLVARNHASLSLLINNAGIWMDAGNNERRTSADGHELVFAVNYLAPYLLTRLLIPVLEKGTPSRIVNVSSIAQSAVNFDDIMLTEGYNPTTAYAQSKLALIMLTLDLAAELPADKVTANVLHPATLMDTAMVDRAGMRARATVADGADAVLQLASSPELAGQTGLYYNQLDAARSSVPQAYDLAARARLKALSSELTGVG